MSFTYWIDVKYANLLSTRLERFKVKKNQPFLANYRCFACGDSLSNKTKMRGYIYEKEGRLKAKCHNCDYHNHFFGLLNDVDPALASEYRLETLKESSGEVKEREEYKPDIAKFNKPRFQKFEPLKELKRVSQLPVTHKVAQYVKNRLIPSKYHYKLYFAPKFNAWVNSILPGKFDEKQIEYDEPRLVIPFVDENGYCFGFQGRSFKKDSTLRYITIMLDEAKPKVFGLDTVNFTKDFFIFEGPIDSMFLNNSLALAGSDGSILNILARDKAILVYDNEPRNKAILSKIESAIDNNFRVVIFPETIKEKDINDLVLSGKTVREVETILYTNSCRGMVAKLRFNEWKKA